MTEQLPPDPSKCPPHGALVSRCSDGGRPGSSRGYERPRGPAQGPQRVPQGRRSPREGLSSAFLVQLPGSVCPAPVEDQPSERPAASGEDGFLPGPPVPQPPAPSPRNPVPCCRGRCGVESGEGGQRPVWYHPHYLRLPRWLSGKEPACPYRRHGFDPWVGKTPWRRAWQPTPVFSPGESHGQRSLAGYGPWGCKELHVTEVT